jgi:ATP-binding cassette, subfamily B, bacterial
MTGSVEMAAWPARQATQALEALARRCGLPIRSLESLPLVTESVLGEPEVFDSWLRSVGRCLGLELVSVQAQYSQVDALLESVGPALLQLPGGDVLAIHGGNDKSVNVVGQDGLLTRLSTGDLKDALHTHADERLMREAESVISTTSLSGQERRRVLAAIVDGQLATTRIGACWLVRLSPGASFWKQMRHAGTLGYLAGFLASHVGLMTATVASWWLLGRGALEARLDAGWLFAWALLLLSLVPMRVASSWLRGVFSLRIGLLLQQRLLLGALQLEPEEVRHQGAGQALGRAVESSAVGSLALSTVLAGFGAVIELAFALGVLSLGAGGALRVALLAAWMALTVGLGYRTYRHTVAWTEARLSMTHDLVEQMMGHRTRLAQEPPEQWHDAEDVALSEYTARSRKLDRAVVTFSTWISRGWLLAGFAGLLPLILVAGHDVAPLAVGLGGVLLAAGALGSLAASFRVSTAALVAWRQASLLYHAAERDAAPAAATVSAAVLEASMAEHSDGPVIEADHLVFRHSQRAEPILRDCSLRIAHGDRILIEGVSGSGKSTLAGLLTGLRTPDSGLLLARGLDHPSLGNAGWRRVVVSSPQFHDNHVFSNTFSFNLLMGRRWPPELADLDDAERVCRALGLGELLDRMPGGLNQMVGESGWRLSHGEMSRMFVARAILQGSELLVFDESFAALDPVNLERCLLHVLEGTPTLMVIAHP